MNYKNIETHERYVFQMPGNQGTREVTVIDTEILPYSTRVTGWTVQVRDSKTEFFVPIHHARKFIKKVVK